MSQKHHSPSTDNKSDQAIDSAIDRGIIEKAITSLVDDTSKNVTAIALACENGVFHSSIKGKGIDIANLFATILMGRDEQTRSLATILVATPFVFCQSCTDEERVKEVMEILHSSYHDLFSDDSLDYSDPDAN